MSENKRFTEEQFSAACAEARWQHPEETEQQIRDRAAYRLSCFSEQHSDQSRQIRDRAANKKRISLPEGRLLRLIFEIFLVTAIVLLLARSVRCEPNSAGLRRIRELSGQPILFPQIGVPTVVRLQVRSAGNVWTDVGFFGGNLNVPISGTVSLSGTNPFNLAQVGGTAVSGANVVDGGNTAFRVNCVVGCAGSSFTDNSAFTAGTTTITNIGGVFNDGLGAVTSGNAAAPRITSSRAVHVNLRNNSGTEIGIAATPLRVDPTGTTTQPVNLAQVGGTAVSGANVVDGGNTAFRVNCVVGCAGSSFTDNSAFTAGTTTITNVGGVFDDGLAAVTSGNAAAPRITSFRGIHVNLRNNSGTEIGIAATPVRVDPTGTTTQPINVAQWNAVALGSPSAYGTSPGAVNVPGVNAFITNTPAVTLTSTTITGTVAVTQSTSPWVDNITQFGGTNISTGTGASGLGIPRVTVSNDSSILGTKTNNAAAPGATNFGALGALANAANPAWTEGNLVLQSVDLSGRQRVNLSAWGGTALGTPTNFGTTPGAVVAGSVNSSLFIATTAAVAAAAGVQAVGIRGNANANLDAANNAALPANVLMEGLEVISQGTQPTAATSGNARRVLGSTEGVQFVQQGNSNRFSCFVEAVTVTTQCQAAPGAGLRAYVTSAILSNEAATVQTLDIIFGTGANCATAPTALTHKIQLGTNATTTSPFAPSITFLTPLIPTAANAICVRPSAATAFGATITGFIAP